MSLRTRLSLNALETRENPSGPELIDPIGMGYTPPATGTTDPVVTAPPTDPTGGTTGTTGTTGTPIDWGYNDIYKFPIEASLMTITSVPVGGQP